MPSVTSLKCGIIVPSLPSHEAQFSTCFKSFTETKVKVYKQQKIPTLPFSLRRESS